MVTEQQKSCILNILEKTPNFGRTVHTLDNTLNLKIKFSEAYTQRSMGICKKNQEKSIFVQFLGGVSKKKFSIFQVLGTVYFAVCHIYELVTLRMQSLNFFAKYNILFTSSKSRENI